MRGIITGCLIICLLGVALRYPLLSEGGHKSDLGFFADWANTIHDYGLAGVYDKSKMRANYPVGFMYILSVFDGMAQGGPTHRLIGGLPTISSGHSRFCCAWAT